jgi:hypothetical protein
MPRALDHVALLHQFLFQVENLRVLHLLKHAYTQKLILQCVTGAGGHQRVPAQRHACDCGGASLGLDVGTAGAGKCSP